jgi:hypothetical protein
VLFLITLFCHVATREQFFVSVYCFSALNVNNLECELDYKCLEEFSVKKCQVENHRYL